jgi:cyclopropane fatty-acyl-phospholipid synthase-like methyltransferase/DNA-binding MarR family transcriptional regulator
MHEPQPAFAIPGLPREPLPPPSASPLELGTQALPDAPPAFLVRFGMGLRRTLLQLADLVTPPHLAMMDRSLGLSYTSMLSAVARLGIADLLEASPRSAEQIAQELGLHADTVMRVLRALVSRGIFRRLADGRFANNRLSRALKGGRADRMREWVTYFGSQSNVATWNDLERTLRTGNNAFERVFGMDIWQWFDGHPDEREMFAQAMMGITVAEAPAVARLYPFHEIQTLCDVGGGRGTLMSELLVRYPHLRGVLVDGQGVLESARELLARRGVSDRVELCPGSFFDSVPEGADAYLLKSVLHDWDDARCKIILRNVRRAMKPGQRILLVEMLAPRHDDDSVSAFADVHMMMVCCNGRERSFAELQALLHATGFASARLFPYPTSNVIDAVAVG